MFSFLGGDVDFEPSTSSPSAVPTQEQLPVSEQEQHVCETCGIHSESEKALVKHNVIHDWEKCHMCTVCRWYCHYYSEHSKMVTHIKTHTTSNEQHTEDLFTVMFDCIVCGKLFIKRSELHLHYNVHSKV